MHIRADAAARFLVPIGRALFAAVFIASGYNHFSQRMIAYGARQGMPLASVLVPAAGVLALAGGLLVLVGLRTRIGAALLALFLVSTTPVMHAFWAARDPLAAQLQQTAFMQNLALAGGALLLMYFGGGPLSLDARADAQRDDADEARDAPAPGAHAPA